LRGNRFTGIAAIEDYLATHNENPKPLVWTATAESIVKKSAAAERHSTN
jgi:hypothetical protein